MKRSIAILLIALEVLCGLSPAFAGTSTEWRVNLVRTGGSSAGTFTGATFEQAHVSCVSAAAALGLRPSGYDCQTARLHVTVTTDTPPPLPAVDCAFTTAVTNGQWLPAACPASGQQTRTVTTTRTVTRQPANGGIACPTPLDTTAVDTQPCVFVPPVDPPPPPPSSTVGSFYDLTHVPACMETVTRYSVGSDGVRTAQLVDAAGSGLPITTGHCLEATPATLKAVWANAKPCDVVDLRAGIYNKVSGDETWYQDGMLGTLKKGTADCPIALRAHPGEEVIFTQAGGHAPVIFGDEGRSPSAAYLTLAGIQIKGREECIGGGGNSQAGVNRAETGGDHIRIVGVDCSISDATANTMTGMIQIQGDGWKVLGVTLTDPPNRVVQNNNHGIYIQGGSDDVELGYINFKVHTGHVVQVHQDGAPFLYERLDFHDLRFVGTNYGDMRGIGLINIQGGSSASIRRAYFRHQGQGGWGCINVYGGNVSIDNVDCQDSQGGVQVNNEWKQARRVSISNSLICPAAGFARFSAEQGASLNEISETAKKSCP